MSERKTPSVGVHEGLVLDEEKKRLWKKIQENLKERLGLERYSIWFKQAELMKWDSSCLVIGVPSVVIKQYLDQEYMAPVKLAVEELLGSRVQVSFDVAPNLLRKLREGQQEDSDVRRPQDTPLPAPQTSSISAPTKSRDGFEELIITDSNRLPYTAAREIACDRSPQFRFLVVLGEHGVGKSALMNAIHRTARGAVAQRSECVTAETWCNEYYYSLQSKRVRAFQQRYRNCDMLLLDGIQALEGKPSAQEEFVYTAKSLLAKEGRLVVSSTIHPNEFLNVRPAFKSFLGGALWVRLVMPPRHERKWTARQLTSRLGLKASSEVFGFLADCYSNSIQQMQGAVSSLAAYASLQRREEMDLPAAKEALSALSPPQRRMTTLNNIQEAVLSIFSITESQLKGSSRSRYVCRARQVAMYLAHQYTCGSLSDVGRFFGGRTHSTVKHAISQVEKQINKDGEIPALLEHCRARLQRG